MIQNIKKDIISVGASDPDRKLFDELVPLPDGTTYNSYLIVGSEKTVLIDTVDTEMTDVLINNLSKLNVTKIDYVVANHAEQDHTGALPEVLKRYPEAIVLCSQKCMPMLIDHLGIEPSRIKVVVDKEEISLGNKTLEFVYTPWVHWPETMSTYLKEDKILFSCDFFGSHYATEDLFFNDADKVTISLKRYYAEIMMPFRTIIKSNINKLSLYEIKMICPSHGPLHQEPDKIIALYQDWVSDKTDSSVVIAYVSMHGSVKAMVKHLEESLKQHNIEVKMHNLTEVDLGQLAIDLVDASTIIVGASAMLVGIHPTVMYGLYLVNALRPKTKYASVLGSYGWADSIIKEISPVIKNLKVEIIDPVIVKGYPKKQDLDKIDELAIKIKDLNHTLNK
jgi:flavorubredoxin